jgi:hypothetical protein
MADITYKCPKCSATLKPGRPIPAGKKIKCPKCENIFAPDAGPKEKAAATTKPSAEDEGGMYGFKDEPAPPPPVEVKVPVDEDDDEEDKPRKKKKTAESDLEEALLNKQPKRKKGVAQAMCQGPSNKLLATSSFVCVSCLVSILTVLWPLLFSLKKSSTLEFMGVEKFPIWLLALLSVGAFLYSGMIAVGAVKMQSMESLGWARLASILIMLPSNWALAIPAFAWLIRLMDSMIGKDGSGVPNWGTLTLVSLWYVFVGMNNLRTLSQEDVLAGFAEQSPHD